MATNSASSNENKYLILLGDVSGSMSRFSDTLSDSFYEWIMDEGKMKDITKIRIVKFNGYAINMFAEDFIDVKTARMLSEATFKNHFQTNGCTRLYGTIFDEINKCCDLDAESVTMVIFTDGMDNDKTEDQTKISLDDVNQKIDSVKNMRIILLDASQCDVGSNLNIDSGYKIEVTPSSHHIETAVRCVSDNIRDNTPFTPLQREITSDLSQTSKLKRHASYELSDDSSKLRRTGNFSHMNFDNNIESLPSTNTSRQVSVVQENIMPMPLSNTIQQNPISSDSQSNSVNDNLEYEIISNDEV